MTKTIIMRCLIILALCLAALAINPNKSKPIEPTPLLTEQEVKEVVSKSWQQHIDENPEVLHLVDPLHKSRVAPAPIELPTTQHTRCYQLGDSINCTTSNW